MTFPAQIGIKYPTLGPTGYFLTACFFHFFPYSVLSLYKISKQSADETL